MLLNGGRRCYQRTRQRRHIYSLPPSLRYYPACAASGGAGSGAEEGGEQVARNLLPASDRPLVCLLSWVGASEKVALKYASIYRQCGMDVLLQLTRPLHVICPVSHGRADSAALVRALRSSEARDRPLAVAAFSAGGYMLGNALLELRDGAPLGGEDVLKGINGTIFAYGQTGSGKTFTITGGAERYEDRGLIPRTIAHIFECFRKGLPTADRRLPTADSRPPT